MKPTQGKRRQAPARAPKAAAALPCSRDYTPEVLHFLAEHHGKIRIDSKGDYFYEQVSAVSLHFLLKSNLPSKEVLWQWYAHFERERATSIYQTLGPQNDEVLLRILERCDFRWDPQRVRESGLVFLPQHRQEVFLALEDFLMQRIEAYETMPDAELAQVLRPEDTWSDEHLRRLIRRIQTRPFTAAQRQTVYDQFESDYLRATARVMLQELSKESFWKQPPPEMEEIESRLIAFARAMASTARRLGVYVSRSEYEQATKSFGTGGPRPRHAAGNGQARREPYGRTAAQHHSSFEVLGLAPDASLLDVKSAYRRKVKETHPDQGGTVQGFLKLQEAYEVLLTEVF